MCEERKTGLKMCENKTGLRIMTWNINGLRSFSNFPDVVRELKADIICFQETKVTRDMLPEPSALIPGYSSYYTYTRNGTAYSGVATYVKNSCTPVATEDGITGYLSKLESEGIGGTHLLQQEFTQDELKNLDSEGRCVITKHKIQQTNKDAKEHLILINVYCPRADPEREDRKQFKLEFYKALDIRANTLAEEGNYVVVLGDINTSHREIDHCDPYDEFYDHPGRRFLNHFLDIEQEKTLQGTPKTSETNDAGLDGWECERVNINKHQFHDAFRIFHGSREQAFTCWNTMKNCRSTNFGTRIDYIFLSDHLKQFVSDCDIHADIVGSDHCPVSASFNINIIPESKPPPLATKYYPEFQGRQLNIKDMFSAPPPAANKRPLSQQQDLLSCQQAPAKRAKQSTAAKKPAKITNFFTTTKTKRQDVNINVQTASDVKALEGSNSKSIDSFSFKEDIVGQEFLMEESLTQKVVHHQESKAAWGKLFKAPRPNPLCPGHQEECVKRKVNKKGPNQGREFYCCARGEGRADDPNARCNFFKWAIIK